MQKGKRILAVIGIVVLVGLYVTTFVLAIVDNSNTMNLFFASVAATILVPVLIWIYSFIYKLLTKNRD